MEERIIQLERRQVDLEVDYQPQSALNAAHHRVNERPPENTTQVPLVRADGALTRCSPAIGLISTFSRSADENLPSVNSLESQTAETSDDYEHTEVLPELREQEALFDLYYEKVHCRYPFLRLSELRASVRRSNIHGVAFFVRMIFAIGLLLDTNTQRVSRRHNHQELYRIAVTQDLSQIFAQSERLLHIQAYLLLAIHSVYSPSTERIISTVSATMRYCVMAQLHSAAAEPHAVDAATNVTIQMRRRVFWSAYSLDRTVSAVFDLPSSIPDSQITVKLYSNINEDELEVICATSFPREPKNVPGYTDMAAGLHVVYCRQIQSEILNNTLHRDFNKHFEYHHHWRLRVLEKLDRWKSLCHRFSDIASSNFTSNDWLHMIYNYSLVMLFQPNRSTVIGAAGDWTVKACVQACLIFRKFRRETPITELWLGLIAQFKCGVALLYCFFATPPDLRSAAYELPEVPEAVRACSITLSLLAERWPQSKVLRDTFDLLAREVPLFESKARSIDGVPKRMRQDAADSIMSYMCRLEILVVHRDTLRMIKEMASENFRDSMPESTDDPGVTQQRQQPQQATPTYLASDDRDCQSPLWSTGLTEEFFQPFTPCYAQVSLDDLDTDQLGDVVIGFPGGFDFGSQF